MVDLSLELLGSFQVRLNGQPIVRFRTNKARALLVYLAVENSPAADWRPLLTDLFWPGRTHESAQQNLRQTIYLLRKELVAADGGFSRQKIVLADQQRVLLDPAVDCCVDVRLFNNLLEQCWRHQHPEMLACRDCIGRFREAADLYQGDFLADFYLEGCQGFEDWAASKRVTLQRAMIEALEKLAANRLWQGNLREARRLARRQLALDNFRERAYQQLMEALARGGRRHEALVAFDEFEQLLQQEMGMRPLRNTRLLRDRIAAGDLDEAASAAR